MTDQIDVTILDLPVLRLPKEFKGLLACQLSDLHVDSEMDLFRLDEAVRIINAHCPDLIFLTGDYFSRTESMFSYMRSVCRSLAELRPSLGLFAIAGNHDHLTSFSMISEAFKAAGICVLANQNHPLELGDSRIIVVGIDDLWSQRAQPARAFRGVRPKDCTILLAHNPDTALYVRYLRPGVILSGHTHGGVIRVPVYGSPVRSFLKIGRKFYAGLNRYDDFYIYTNRGLGAFPVNLRVNCRPEISMFRFGSLSKTQNHHEFPEPRAPATWQPTWASLPC